MELPTTSIPYHRRSDRIVGTRLWQKPCLLQEEKGWGSGWRDFELESIDNLREALVDCGTDLDGFEEYLSEEGPGAKELTRCIRNAEKTGIAGVPHYVLADQSDHKGLSLFGREHLALIRTRLSERNLARSTSVKPEFSHTWSGSDKK